MVSANETVVDIVSEIRKVAHNAAIANEETKEHWRPAAFLASVADRIEAACGREVAARLRKLTLVEAALNINVGMNNAAATITADLRRRLKVAEDALEDGMFNLDAWVNGGRFAHTESNDDSLSKMRNALAAIREEGGAK